MPGVEGKARLRADLIFARDPELSIRLLTGAALVEHMLRNLVDDVAASDDEFSDVGGRIAVAVERVAESLAYAYTPPSDWVTNLSVTSIAGAEGDTVSTVVDLAAPSQGSAYFAVEFYDSGDETVGETTNALMVTVDAELAVGVVPDPTDIPLPELVGM